VNRSINMPLIYTLVAKGTTVLAEYSLPSVSGNFTMVTRRILEKIPPQNAKMSYMYDRHIFHYIVDDGLVFLTMADEAFGRRLPFTFLEDIRTRFRATYGDRGRTAMAGAMNEDFGRVLQVQMEYYSNNPGADKITKVKEQIDEVKEIMVQNIEKVLERSEKIELLVDKTEALNANALNFKRQSTGLRQAMFWKNVKLWIILGIVAVIVIYVIVAIICGPLLKSCISSSSPTTPAPTTAAPTTPAPTSTPTTSASNLRTW